MAKNLDRDSRHIIVSAAILTINLLVNSIILILLFSRLDLDYTLEHNYFGEYVTCFLAESVCIFSQQSS